jgi:hypothetical protein
VFIGQTGAFSLQTVTANQAAINANNAGHDGGGVYVSQGGLLQTQRVNITTNALNANRSGHDGGGIYIAAGGTGQLQVTEMKVSTNSLNANSAGNFGGGIFNGGGVLTLTGLHVNANTATHKGGGIYNALSGKITFTGNKNSVMSNKAGDPKPSGGGIFNVSGNAANAVVTNGAKVQSNKPDQCVNVTGC